MCSYVLFHCRATVQIGLFTPMPSTCLTGRLVGTDRAYPLAPICGLRSRDFSYLNDMQTLTRKAQRQINHVSNCGPLRWHTSHPPTCPATFPRAAIVTRFVLTQTDHTLHALRHIGKAEGGSHGGQLSPFAMWS